MKKIFLILVGLTCAFTLWSQNSLRIGAGAYITSSGGAYIILDNVNIVNNGTLQQPGGDGFVMLTGATNVSLSGSGSTNINTLVLAKNAPATFDLQANLNVVSKVNFSGGLLNLNNSVLNLGSTGIFSNESEISRAFTTGTGYIERTGILNNPSAVNLGNLGAVITSTINLGNTIIRRGHKVQTGISGSNNSIARYYDIIPMNNTALKATLRFYYFNAELNSLPEATLYHWQSPNLVNWNLMGADSRDVNANYVERKTYGKFDRVTLATASAPGISCPPNQTVSANQSGCKASVSFAASATGIPTPSIIYKIGNTVITSPYVFSKGTTTVTATASNGVLPDATCSFTVTVVCGSNSSARLGQTGIEPGQDQLNVTALPNPSSTYFTFMVKSSNSQPVNIRIMDLLGRLVAARSNVPPQTTLYFGHDYLPGVYFVQATQGNKIVILKLVKQAH